MYPTDKSKFTYDLHIEPCFHITYTFPSFPRHTLASTTVP